VTPNGHPTAVIAVPMAGAAELPAAGANLLRCVSSDTSQVITITSDTSAGGALLGASRHFNEPFPANHRDLSLQAVRST
jgi:hypothetical protein